MAACKLPALRPARRRPGEGGRPGKGRANSSAQSPGAASRNESAEFELSPDSESGENLSFVIRKDGSENFAKKAPLSGMAVRTLSAVCFPNFCFCSFSAQKQPFFDLLAFINLN